MDAIFQCIPIIGKFEKGNICPFFIIMLLQKYYSIPLDAALKIQKDIQKLRSLIQSRMLSSWKNKRES